MYLYWLRRDLEQSWNSLGEVRLKDNLAHSIFWEPGEVMESFCIRGIISAFGFQELFWQLKCQVNGMKELTGFNAILDRSRVGGEKRVFQKGLLMKEGQPLTEFLRLLCAEPLPSWTLLWRSRFRAEGEFSHPTFTLRGKKKQDSILEEGIKGSSLVLSRSAGKVNICPCCTADTHHFSWLFTCRRGHQRNQCADKGTYARKLPVIWHDCNYAPWYLLSKFEDLCTEKTSSKC